MKRRFNSPADPKSWFTASEMQLPTLMHANIRASKSFRICPQKTPGYCRAEFRYPCPVRSRPPQSPRD